MSDKLQQQAPTVQPAAPAQQPAAPAQDAQSQLGNSFVQQQGGAMTWSAAMGDFLGPKLYEALAPQLTDEKLVGHAQSAVSGATGRLRSYLQANVQANEQEAANLFVTALDGELRRVAQGLVVDSGLSEGLRDWVDENPLTVATAALAGAVAYVMSNQDLPLVDTSRSLGGGHSVVAGIDPGRTLDLALEQVRVGYRYQSAGTKAELMGDYFGADGGYQLQGTLQQQLAGGALLTGSALHSERSGTTRDRLDVGYSSSALAANAYYERMRGQAGDLSTVGGRISNVAEPDQLQAYLRGEARSDGSYEAAGGLSRKVDNWGWGVEGFANRNAMGQSDQGVRAMFQMRF
ncbi:hypothetical protein L6R53_23115 [Myxococcota bacterium]|nr:hypothetical protein [Myxococcota bacterium]